MPTSEHYRKNAEECHLHAIESCDPHERDALLRMAAQWDRLADHKVLKNWSNNSPGSLFQFEYSAVVVDIRPSPRKQTIVPFGWRGAQLLPDRRPAVLLSVDHAKAKEHLATAQQHSQAARQHSDQAHSKSQ